MNEDKGIMQFERVLPPNFNGVFPFTNPSDEDFIGVWASREYLFPAKSTVPLIIPEHSPLEIQHIRKKLAKDLAEREFYKSKGYKVLQGQEGKPGNRTMNSIHQTATYTLKDLEPYIKKCLDSLPAADITARPMAKVDLEEKLKRDESTGALVTEAVDQKTSLRKRALEA